MADIVGYTVRFEGGALGGQTQFQYGVFDARDIHVPVVTPARIDARMTYAGPKGNYDTDLYRFMGERRGGDPIYVYRWVRPDVPSLREKIRRLERELAECRKPPPRQGLMRFSR